jgi:hypothetical protein
MATVIRGTDNSVSTPAVSGADGDTGLYFPAANQAAIATGGTQALLANSSQGVQFANTIGVGGATPSTSGAGITFPATQSSSSNANTLDDYEEGTWTLTVTPGSGSFTVANNTGYYVKIGRVVYINMWWRRTGETGLSGSITASGFPFPFASDATDIARQRLWLSGYAFGSLTNRSVMWVTPDGGGSATTATFFALPTDYTTGQTLTAGNFSGLNTEVYINGFYMTN